MSNTFIIIPPNYELIDEEYENIISTKKSFESKIESYINYSNFDDNNPQSETNKNKSNELVHFNNETSFNEKDSEKIHKKNKNAIISKKRQKTKTSNIVKENKKEKEKNSHKDNSIKEGLKALILIVKIIIETFGNITLPKFDCNDLVGGTLQNEILCRSKMYQIFGHEKKYRQILENAKPVKPMDEKIFNYFMTRNYNYLFRKYYLNDNVFLIEGKYEIIDLFRTFNEEIKRRKESIYKFDDEKKKVEKIKNFIDASKIIFNNFKGCKRRLRGNLKYYDRIKIDKFDNYLKHSNNLNNNEEKEKEKINDLIKKASDDKSLKSITAGIDIPKSEEFIELRKDIFDILSKNNEMLLRTNSDNIDNIYENNLLGETVLSNRYSFTNKTTNYYDDNDNDMPSPINTKSYVNDIFEKNWDIRFFQGKDLH